MLNSLWKAGDVFFDNGGDTEMNFVPTKRAIGLVLMTFVYILTKTAIATDAEERGDSLVRNLAAIAVKTQTLSANIELTSTTSEGLHRNVGTLKLMKPNYAFINLKGDYPVEVLASDGKSVFILADKTKYKQQKSDPRGATIDSPWFGMPFRHFFTQSLNPFGPDPDPTAKIRYTGEEIVDGETFQVLVAEGKGEGTAMSYTARYYFGQDNLMHRSIVAFGTPPKQASFAATLTNIRTDSKMNIAEFQFKPPKDAKLEEGVEDRLLPLGKQAPEFSLPTPAGQKKTLAEIGKGKKATLINFWFLNCPPCRREFPYFEKLYKELKTKGLEIVAIDMGDSPAPVADYVRKEGLTFQVLMGGKDDDKSVFKIYQVATYPTTYILNSEGKLAYRTTAFDLDHVRKALASLGVK